MLFVWLCKKAEPSIQYSDEDKVCQRSVQGAVSGHCLGMQRVRASGDVVPPHFSCVWFLKAELSLPYQIPEFSKYGSFDRGTISFLKSICEYYEISAAGCREQMRLYSQE